jgi:hypothetical protein
MTLSDLVQIGTICGIVIALVQAAIKFGDRMWGKKTESPVNADDTQASFVMNQMKMFMHAGEIKELLREQNESLKILVNTLTDSVHQETLRYELLMAKLKEVQSNVFTSHHH